MNKDELYHTWLKEEKIAHIKGWDFSHINDRYKEEDKLPWDYLSIIKQYLKDDMHILDLDTGGGEFLLGLNHPYELISATENYPPNIAYCKEKLLPLGIDFKDADAKGGLPFDDNTFDIVLNRHGDFNPDEIKRVLKPGGYFITQQVGALNDHDLVMLLLGDLPLPFPRQYLAIIESDFIKAGFTIIKSDEAFNPIIFYDVGALVWFAHIIEWEFPNFSVDKHLKQLYNLQAIIEKEGYIKGTTHRFMLVAQKPLI